MQLTVTEFQHSLSDADPPAGLSLALQALWWAGKGDWAQAHGCAQQQEGDPGCDLVHAHLHRQEGDLGNARYWYSRAGRPFAEESLQDEWNDIIRHLLR